jgi:hypothetical protein
MNLITLTHKHELELGLTKENFRIGLEFNVSKPRIGSFFMDQFSSTGPKYKGKVNDSSFSLSFPKSIYRPELFYTVISGNFIETETGLNVKVRVSAFNWYIKTLISQFILAAIFVAFLATGVNDLTGVIVMLIMVLTVFCPIVGIELYFANKGAITAMREIKNDILTIATTYNKH